MSSEGAAITNIEKAYMKRSPRKRYCACEELDHYWDEFDFPHIIKMWKADANPWEIAEHYGRHPAEVLVLLIDLAMKGRIKARKHGLFGNLNTTEGRKNHW